MGNLSARTVPKQDLRLLPKTVLTMIMTAVDLGAVLGPATVLPMIMTAVDLGAVLGPTTVLTMVTMAADRGAVPSPTRAPGTSMITMIRTTVTRAATTVALASWLWLVAHHFS